MPLEKNADYLISDRLSKSRTPACLSWLFVTDSIRNGAVQEEDEYRLIQSPMAGHNARSSKSKRVPFTKEDDAILARWVLSRQHSGGNKIYQELERTVCCCYCARAQVTDLVLGSMLGIHGSHGGAVFSASWKYCLGKTLND